MDNKTLLGVLFAVFSLACIVGAFLLLRAAARKTGWPQSGQRSFLLRAGMVLAGWTALFALLSLLGFFQGFSTLPPRVPLILLPGLAGIFFLLSRKRVQQLLQAMPPHWPVYLQSFRIGVEVLLWLGYSFGLLPVQMSWEGYNYDVLSGLLALPAGFFMARMPRKRKWIGLAYNITGLALLLNILVIAVLSMPTPFRYFTAGPSNALVAAFPFILLPAVLVMLALALHVFSLKQVLGEFTSLRVHKFTS